MKGQRLPIIDAIDTGAPASMSLGLARLMVMASRSAESAMGMLPSQVEPRRQ